MINTKHLQKKGLPIKRDHSLNIIDSNNDAHKKPLQIMLPKNLFEEFSSIAGKKFGYIKGAKTKLFLELWENYKNMIK